MRDLFVTSQGYDAAEALEAPRAAGVGGARTDPGPGFSLQAGPARPARPVAAVQTRFRRGAAGAPGASLAGRPLQPDRRAPLRLQHFAGASVELTLARYVIQGAEHVH